jgi:NAD(P)-dependent dehydrogenase (short-subunit alcohol dehydrogenase family)
MTDSSLANWPLSQVPAGDRRGHGAIPGRARCACDPDRARYQGARRRRGSDPQRGGKATIAPLELTEPDAIARLASAIGERWSALDILVINAGVLPTLTPVTDIDGKALNKAVATNILATQALLACFHPMLKRSSDARVVGLTTSVAPAPRAFWGAYAATKAAQEVLLDCYAQENRNISKIRVAIVNPGATRTAMRARAYPGENPASVKPPEVVGEAIAELILGDFPVRTG